MFQKQKKKVKEHTRNDSTGAAIKSGAAAFFGAMGSDWFSTSWFTNIFIYYIVVKIDKFYLIKYVLQI